MTQRARIYTGLSLKKNGGQYWDRTQWPPADVNAVLYR
jgi:hypothetical protein